MKRYYILLLQLLCVGILSAAIPLSPQIVVPDTIGEAQEPAQEIGAGDSGSKGLQYFHHATVNKGNVFSFVVGEPLFITFDFSDFSYYRSVDGDPLPASDFNLCLLIHQIRGEYFEDSYLPFGVRSDTHEIFCNNGVDSCSYFIPPGHYEITYTGFDSDLTAPIQPGVSLANSVMLGANSSVTLHYSATSYTYDELPTDPYPDIPDAVTTVTNLAATSGQNSIVKRTYRNAEGTVFDETTEYYDGLGRLKETVLTGITPDGTNLVTLTRPDALGREHTVWLPGIDASASGNAYVDPSAVTSSSMTIHDDSKPYSYSVYENSPLGRVVEQYGAGASWHAAGKRIVNEYLANNSSQAELTVRLFTYTNSIRSGGISSSGYYADGTLRAKRVTDEDGRITLTFTDRQEHIVLKRSIADGGNYHDTYYIYDDFGLLQAVLPPALSAQAGNGTLDSDLVDQYAYLYQYNARNELTGRKLPGAGWENFGYDTDTNRLIWSQNAVQRANQEYTVYLYDALGRECVRGIMDLWPSGLLHPVKYTGSASGLGGYEVTGGANVALKKVLAVNYYDNYQFVEASSIPRSLLPAQASCHVTQGLLTGTLQARLSADADAGDTPMCADVLYYDYRGNIIRDISSNPLGGYDVEDIGYNFTRQVISRTVTHHADIPGKKITETYAYTYDHAGRAVKTTHSVGGNPGVTLVENSYDALGRLASTARGGSSLLGTAYAYNIRDWMTGLDNSLFSEELHYTDNPYNTGNRSYSGNIIAVGWRTDQTQRAYDFTYDNLSRLTGARYHEEGADGRYTTQYSYDSMGNMLTLKRNGLQDGGTYGQVDNLSYSYDGNQLTKISDSVEDPSCVGAFNFRDGADDEVEYTYDANGNMTSDKNRGITAIAYNVIGQPERITFADGKTTEYVYSYDGTKLQVTHKSQLPPTETTTTYCDNLVYENGVLKQILVGGGYVTLNGSTPVYHFYIRDHLGNNRVVAKADGTVEQTNHYYPYGGLMADISTGSDLQPYKYNGKELDRMHGLDTYDYGARQYAAAIGRWDRVDPLCEKYYDVSPYAYCGGNPINAIDPDGRSYDWYQDEDETYQYSPDVHSQKDLLKGQIYKGKSFTTGRGNNVTQYRSDGSILYANETAAYNRMWNQADVHFRQMGEKGGREVGGFILNSGKVLVLPDYKNDVNTSEISEYGYKISRNGFLTKGKETFSVLANIHTHQKGSGDPTPSFVGNSDAQLSENLGSLPVFVMGHNGKMTGIISNSVSYAIFNLPCPYNKLNNLLNGIVSFSNYVKKANWSFK